MAKTDIICTTQEIASLLLLTTRRVNQLTKEGTIPKAGRGKYKLDASVRGYVEYLQQHSIRSDKSPIDYAAEKARLTKAQADREEVLAAKAMGQVVDLDVVSKNLASLFLQISSNIRNIPSRVVSSIVGSNDDKKIQAILSKEINQTLHAIADVDFIAESMKNDE